MLGRVRLQHPWVNTKEKRTMTDSATIPNSMHKTPGWVTLLEHSWSILGAFFAILKSLR